MWENFRKSGNSNPITFRIFLKEFDYSVWKHWLCNIAVVAVLVRTFMGRINCDCHSVKSQCLREDELVCNGAFIDVTLVWSSNILSASMVHNHISRVGNIGVKAGNCCLGRVYSIAFSSKLVV